MVVRRECPKCEQELELPDLWAGKIIPCPSCDGLVHMSTRIEPDHPTRAEQARPDSEPVQPRYNSPDELDEEPQLLEECPMCGEDVDARAQACQYCGEPLNRPGESRWAPPTGYAAEVVKYRSWVQSVCIFWLFEAFIVFMFLCGSGGRGAQYLPVGWRDLGEWIVPLGFLACLAHFILGICSISGNRFTVIPNTLISGLLLLVSIIVLGGMITMNRPPPLMPAFALIVPVKLLIFVLSIQVLVRSHQLNELGLLSKRRPGL